MKNIFIIILAILVGGCASTNDIRENSFEIISKAINDGINVNLKLPDDSYLLIHAAENNDSDSVELLLKKGANPNVSDKDRKTALMYAVECNNYYMAGDLLNNGADPNVISRTGEDALTSSHDLKMAKLLVSHGADLSLKASKGSFESYQINTNCDTWLLKYYISTKGDSKVIEHPGATELIRASIMNDIEKAKNILSVKDNKEMVNKQDDAGWTALMFAARFGYKDIAKLLIMNGADVNLGRVGGRNPLILALYEGDHEVIKLLLENGADPNAHELQVHTLQYSSECRISDLLINHGADINWQLGPGTNTALIASINIRDMSRVRYFCEKDADVNIKGLGECTALIRAVNVCNYEIVSYLLEHKAAVNITNVENMTALDYAMLNINKNDRPLKVLEANLIVQILRSHGAKTAAELNAEKN